MRLASLVLISALVAAAGVQADTSTPAPSMSAPSASEAGVPNARQACRADAQKLCPGKRGREAAACLRSNADKISSDCKDALAKLAAPPSS
jgi:uncharacterized membrane protein